MTRFIIFTEGNKVVDTTAWKLYQVVEDGGEATYVDDAGDERDYRSTIYVRYITITIWLD